MAVKSQQKLQVLHKVISWQDLDKLKLNVEVLVISDLHLGAEFARQWQALKTMKTVKYKLLVLGGDTYQDEAASNPKYLRSMDHEVIDFIRKLPNVIVVRGNHDEDIPDDVLKKQLDAKQVVEYWKGFSCLVIHGHHGKGAPLKGSPVRIFAELTDRMFRLVRMKDYYDQIGNIVYGLPRKVREAAFKAAQEYGVQVVISGHIHKVEFTEAYGKYYINCAGFSCATPGFVTIDKSKVVLYTFSD